MKSIAVNTLLAALVAIGFFTCQAQQANDAGSSSGAAASGENFVLNATQFSDKMKNTADKMILDVRTPGEFSGGFIEGAVNIPVREVAGDQRITSLDKAKPIFVYCLSGARSASAANMLRSSGYSKVYELTGGILTWQNAGLPLVTGNTASKQGDEITMDQYKQMTSGDMPVLVDFYAPWCRPCMEMKPMLEALEKKYEGKAKVLRIDVDKNKGLARSMNIAAIPLLMVYKNGEVTWQKNSKVDKAEELEKAMF